MGDVTSLQAGRSCQNNTHIYATSSRPVKKKSLDFLRFRPLVRHRAASGVIKNTSASSISDRKGLKRTKNQKCWKLDVLFSSAVSPYKFKQGAFASPPSAGPHYESELFSGRDKKKVPFSKKFENFTPAKTKNRHFSPFSTGFIPAKTSTKQRKKPLFENTTSPSCHKRKLKIKIRTKKSILSRFKKKCFSKKKIRRLKKKSSFLPIFE